MNFAKITPLVAGCLLLITSCETTEKFLVNIPAGTKIYTPDNMSIPNGTANSLGKVDLLVSSDMYCGYILAQTPDSDVKIPIGLDYTINNHLGTKAALYTGGIITFAGVGAAAIGTMGLLVASAQGDDDVTDTMGTIAALEAAASGIGAVIGVPSQARLRQTAYDYNFGYEKNQRMHIPSLSFTLLNPNYPKGYDKISSTQNSSNNSRKKASSGKDIIPETTNSTKVNKNRSDYAKTI